MVWVNPPNRVALYLYHAHSQSSLAQPFGVRRHYHTKCSTNRDTNRRGNSKVQTPNTNELPNSNIQNQARYACLGFEHWNFPRNRDAHSWNYARGVAAERRSANIRVSSGALAQLVRAPPCHGGGCGFEPRRLRVLYLNRDTSKFAGPHVWNVDEHWRQHSQRTACCRSNIDGDAGNGTLLR